MSLTEIPVTRLRVSFELEATDPQGLELLHLITSQSPGQFDLKISALTEATPIATAPKPAEDWSKLVAPRLWLQRGRLTEILDLERDLLALERGFREAREAAQDLGARLPSGGDYHGPIPPSQVSPLTTPGAFDNDKLEVRYSDPLPPPAAAPAAPPPPPSAKKAETPAPTPAAPKSRAEALVMVANVAQDIAKAAPVGKTVPVTPQIPAGPTKMGLRQRLIEKLRALYRSGEPIPGNKELGAELGASKDHIGVALAELRRIEAINYEWRPDPTPEDETLQRRFVTKA